VILQHSLGDPLEIIILTIQSAGIVSLIHPGENQNLSVSGRVTQSKGESEAGGKS
jgi:hypothetical protein